MTAKTKALSRRRKETGHRKSQVTVVKAEKAGIDRYHTGVGRLIHENRRLLHMAIDNGHPVAIAIKKLTGSLQANQPHSDE